MLVTVAAPQVLQTHESFVGSDQGGLPLLLRASLEMAVGCLERPWIRVMLHAYYAYSTRALAVYYSLPAHEIYTTLSKRSQPAQALL